MLHRTAQAQRHESWRFVEIRGVYSPNGRFGGVSHGGMPAASAGSAGSAGTTGSLEGEHGGSPIRRRVNFVYFIKLPISSPTLVEARAIARDAPQPSRALCRVSFPWFFRSSIWRRFSVAPCALDSIRREMPALDSEGRHTTPPC